MLKSTHNSVADQINDYVRNLSVEEQKILYLKLQKGELLKRAKKIQNRVKKNKIPAAEIVKQVTKNREKLRVRR